MVEHAASFPPGYVVGVAGNTLAHSQELVAMVLKLAKEKGVNLDHVTFKPIATELLQEPRGGAH